MWNCRGLMAKTDSVPASRADDSGCFENVVPTHWVPSLCIVVDYMYLVGNHFLMGGATLELLS